MILQSSIYLKNLSESPEDIDLWREGFIYFLKERDLEKIADMVILCECILGKSKFDLSTNFNFDAEAIIDVYLSNFAAEIDYTESDILLLFNKKEFKECIVHCKNDIFRNPKNEISFVILSASLAAQGAHYEACLFYYAGLKLFPASAQLISNFGILLERLGRDDEALQLMKRAVSLAPSKAAYLANLASLYNKVGDISNAEIYYLEAVKNDASNYMSHFNLGVIYDVKKLKDKSRFHYIQSLNINQNFCPSLINLANSFRRDGKLFKAHHLLKMALEIEPNNQLALENILVVTLKLGNSSEALMWGDKAYQAHPDNIRLMTQYTQILYNLGKIRRANCIKRYFLHRNQKYSASDLYSLMMVMPEVFSTNAELEKFRDELSDLMDLTLPVLSHIGQGRPPLDPRFRLSYSNSNNVELFSKISSFSTSVFPSLLDYNNNSEIYINRSDATVKRRIGFCSKFLKNHTIGKLFRGIIIQLAERGWDVFVLTHSGDLDVYFWSSPGAQKIKFCTLPDSLAEQRDFIFRLRLGIIFYPDIGMDPVNYSLAHSRLAPVQVTSWGHPDTTGIPQIDYFLSSELIETEGAANHYSEDLIKLSVLPVYYESIIFPKTVPHLNEVQILSGRTVYNCLQPTFKILPDFDDILNKIALKDRNGVFLFLETSASEGIRSRWRRSAPELLEKSKFLGRMSWRNYLACLNKSSVVLDPIDFGCGNTFFESLYVGTPVVTWPKRFMRARIVQGGYDQLGLSSAPIAASSCEYVDLAVEWAHGLEKRMAFRSEVESKVTGNIFDNIAVIDELEAILENF